MGISYSTKATYGSPISQELIDELAKEVLTEEEIEQGYGYDLPYEFRTYFGLDCEAFGDAMCGEVDYIVGYTAFAFNMRYEESYSAIELDVRDEKAIAAFVEKYGLDKPRWYAGMLVH